jgi:hypothetical protein
MKNLWHLWVGIHPAEKTELGVGLYHIDRAMMDEIQDNLLDSQPHTPSALGTIPELADSGFFKAAAWKTFLESYGPSLIHEYLPDDAHKNLCDLQEIWLVLVRRSVTYEDLVHLQAKIEVFIRDFETIYYQNETV